MQIDVKNFFVAKLVPEIYVCEKHKFQKQLDVFFCYSLYTLDFRFMADDFKRYVRTVQNEILY